MRKYLKIPQRYFLLFFAATLVINVQAQRHGRGYRQFNALFASQSVLSDSITAVGQTASARMDSLILAFRTRNERFSGSSFVQEPRNDGDENTIVTNVSDTGNDGDFNQYYYPMIASNTLMREPLHRVMGMLYSSEEIQDGPNVSLLPKALTHIFWTTAEMYVLYPHAVTSDLTSFESSVVEAASSNAPFKQLPVNKNNEETNYDEEATTTSGFVTKREHEDIFDSFDMSDFHITIRRPNFWTFRGSFSTQFMQYYVSENWYKGGENHVSMLGMFNFEANYDNKRKISFTNKLETKLGFQTSPSDTHHHFKTNADLLRLTDKLGIQATKRWYYTVMLQSWTQFYKAYKANSETVSSDIMSPFESVLSVGMDYKLQKKRVNLTATLSPGAINMKYCDRIPLVTNYGIDEGKHSRFDFGSTVTINMTLKFCEQVNWVTRLYAFYDYKDHLKAEWENTINLKVNKYLSTKLFLYPRFDNNVTKKKPEDKYIQFNEYLSVGLDLNF